MAVHYYFIIPLYKVTIKVTINSDELLSPTATSSTATGPPATDPPATSSTDRLRYEAIKEWLEGGRDAEEEAEGGDDTTRKVLNLTTVFNCLN